ncbi:hypothetical protein PROFUN_04632 [Planoprotostelium fungivorum]|uniref:Uncharacterized protein n=1 Tax=Planoprotostelium fungivorum TaxID=1890364 RepID=A0A2P6NUG0_9EUKA|nr:hypothetical protein PROFUN_04632 [Planoprotostelium fungivorum]
MQLFGQPSGPDLCQSPEISQKLRENIPDCAKLRSTETPSTHISTETLPPPINSKCSHTSMNQTSSRTSSCGIPFEERPNRLLEGVYQVFRLPPKAFRQQLARKCGVSTKRVSKWFLLRNEHGPFEIDL